MKESGGTRPYRMGRRAQTTEKTREKILDATVAAFDEEDLEEITLAKIASQAGVTVQTVLRHFGSRAALITAGLGYAATRMRSDRDSAPVGDVDGAVGVLVDHYEEFGDRILRLLSVEERDPSLAVLADLGRVYHLDWCRHVFAPGLEGVGGAKRERRAFQFAAITDIYFWKLLRRDRGLDAAQTKLAMRELLEPLMEPGG